MRGRGRLAAALCLAFAPAADADPAADPAPDAVLASLPFEKDAPPRTIVIDLAPKGNARKLRFQLDTGSTYSIVTPRLARAMGVKVNRLRQDAYRRATVLGRDVQFAVDTRRGDTDSTSGREWGLLGGEFLAQYVVELDFAQQRVRFLEPRLFEVPASVTAEGEAVLPIRVVGNRPSLHVSFDGQARDLLIGSGMDFALFLSGDDARAAGVETTALPGEFATLKGVFGSSQGKAGEVGKLEIGPFVLERVFTVVAPHGFYNAAFPGDSAIGSEVLAQFLVRIDYPRQRIWLRHRADAPAYFDPRRTVESSAGTP